MAAVRSEDFMVASYDITDGEPARKLCVERQALRVTNLRGDEE
ncbi:70_t:CDS:2 [Paraglomus brasilianum]|uniref:70_t:CDS:1 n=1 Tax=Paraglomus brasilianum TaxID=144538 RepID=A0A9N9BV36_9GLOM|nr:70_t:CDS:2 [Paraglomus brasilianum]